MDYLLKCETRSRNSKPCPHKQSKGPDTFSNQIQKMYPAPFLQYFYVRDCLRSAVSRARYSSALTASSLGRLFNIS